MKVFSLVLLFMSLHGFAQAEVVYEKNSKPASKSVLQKLKANSPDKTVLVFTEGYFGDSVGIVVGETSVTKQCMNVPGVGFAALQPVPNQGDVSVIFMNEGSFKCELKAADLQKYKFVYIAKESVKGGHNAKIVFSNEAKYDF